MIKIKLKFIFEKRMYFFKGKPYQLLRYLEFKKKKYILFRSELRISIPFALSGIQNYRLKESTKLIYDKEC